MRKRILMLAGVLAVGAAFPAAAGPCTADLDALQGQVDALVDAVAGSGKFGVESEAATDSRQPTPKSVAEAEAGLGEGRTAQSALAALSEGRSADARGDKAGCERAIEQVRSALRGK